MANQRKRVWIDPFQTKLVVRLLFYAVAYQVTIWVVLYAVQVVGSGMQAITNTPATVYTGWLALFTMLGLMVLLTVDAVRYVHRLVGPIYRFRKTMQALAAGEAVELVRLRHGDFLKDFMVDFNQMLQALEQKGAVTLKGSGALAEAVVNEPAFLTSTPSAAPKGKQLI